MIRGISGKETCLPDDIPEPGSGTLGLPSTASIHQRQGFGVGDAVIVDLVNVLGTLHIVLHFLTLPLHRLRQPEVHPPHTVE